MARAEIPRSFFYTTLSSLTNRDETAKMSRTELGGGGGAKKQARSVGSGGCGSGSGSGSGGGDHGDGEGVGHHTRFGCIV